MSEKKQCAVCNKEFTPCSRCLSRSNGNEVFQWRRVVCCPEHFSFHLPIIDYVRKNIDKETAKKELQTAFKYFGEIDFNDNIKRVVDEIMIEPVVKAAVEPMVEVAEENVAEDFFDGTDDSIAADDEYTDDELSEIKPLRSKKKK